MSTLAELQALANQAAEVGPDMTEAVTGGTARLLPAGYAFGRLVEYVELGKQPQEFNGKAKEPALEVQLGFALWGAGYQNDDGTPYIMRLYPFAISRNEKARAFKLFKLLNWRGTAKSFAQLLSQAFLIKIMHEPKSKTDATVVSRIALDGFLPPLDPVTQAPYAIPEATDDLYRLFLWDFPTKNGWDALYVDGKYDDGKSKNRVQESILAALDFHGSPLQQLLMASGVQALPAGPAVPPQAPAVPTQPAVPATPAAAPAAAPTAPFVPPASPPAQAVVPPVVPVQVAMPVQGIAPPVTPLSVPTFPSSHAPAVPQ